MSPKPETINSKPATTYHQSGVDIEAGNRLVDRIKPLAKSTFRKEVLSEIGGFSGLFAPKLASYREPVIVSGCDGVGTKLKIAEALNKYETIGIDLVAMSVNDLVVTGAEPLFFLDYLAVGRLNISRAEAMIKGVAEGCRQAGCALLGGETAEMPGVYDRDGFDLAGFAVGIVEKSEIIDGSRISTGDKIVGLPSSGLHSNGYSLVRKLIPSQEYTEELLTPTKIYVKTILDLKERFTIKGIAHITGGGMTENIPRILPQGCQAVIKEGSWPVPPIFLSLQEMGNISQEEMCRTFNMGIGMVIILSAGETEECLNYLGPEARVIGEITAGKPSGRTSSGVLSYA
ncbi:MAG: phosphoribosylformylglycinamidine cyclo-ligase [bacterium]|nr:phosphoribosylformylglycinamidine cyclo-ligase [bacterium]